jgi:hypothetical protein
MQSAVFELWNRQSQFCFVVHEQVRQLLPKYFAEAISDVVWGSVEEDQVC